MPSLNFQGIEINVKYLAMTTSVRLDKWLWAARFFKTRSLAQTHIERNRVRVNDETVKPSRLVKIDDVLLLEISDVTRTVVVKGLSENRGSAPIAQALYEETEQSVKARIEQAQRNKLFTEPAAMISGRPTKRDRRDLGRVSGGQGE